MAAKSVPSHWDDNTIITIDEFGEMLGLTEDQLQEWSSRGVGPRWHRFQGKGRLYVTAAEARRYLTTSNFIGGEISVS